MGKEVLGEMNKKILIELSAFERLKEYNRDYEVKVIDFIKQFKDCKELEKILRKTIECTEYKEEINYAAFFALCTIYRRNKDFSAYNELLEKYSQQFEKYISFGHLKAMCLIESVKSKADVIEAIECSKSVIEKVEALDINIDQKKRLNIGFYHSYSVNVAKGFEEGYLKRQNDDEYFILAKEYIRKSIDCNYRYAKFHFTLGRLHLIEKQYQKAIEEFRIAIDYEESSNKDYAIRIGDYQYYISNAKTNMNMESLNAAAKNNMDSLSMATDEVKKELENIRTKNIEVLSFFVAVMSFVIGSIQLANSSNTFIDKAALILLLFGCLLTTLGAFGKNLTGNVKSNYKFSILTGVSMIVGSILLKLFFRI